MKIALISSKFIKKNELEISGKNCAEFRSFAAFTELKRKLDRFLNFWILSLFMK